MTSSCPITLDGFRSAVTDRIVNYYAPIWWRLHKARSTVRWYSLGGIDVDEPCGVRTIQVGETTVTVDGTSDKVDKNEKPIVTVEGLCDTTDGPGLAAAIAVDAAAWEVAVDRVAVAVDAAEHASALTRRSLIDALPVRD